MPGRDGFRRLFRLDRGDRDVDRSVRDELAFHFEMAVADLVASGMTAADARLEAERRFGDVGRTRHRLETIDRARVAEGRRVEQWRNILHDLRFALRMLRRQPGFAAAVILTLALGIGANTTIFGIVDRLLFRPPALLPNPDHVHRLYFARTDNGREFAAANVSYQRYLDVVNGTSAFASMAAFWTPRMAVGRDNANEMRVTMATASFWQVFDVTPVAGRLFTAVEDSPPAGEPVAVLSWPFWQATFGGRRDVLGTRVRIGRVDYTIIGVAPRGFWGLEQTAPAAFIPLSSGADNFHGPFGPGRPSWRQGYGFNWLQIFARRKEGVSIDASTSDLTAAFKRSYALQAAEQHHLPPADVARPRAIVGSILTERGPNQGTNSKVALWLIGVSAIVLIIACANVGNLLLARAVRRRREIAVRLALGISRTRLFSQLLVESTLLAALGAAGGLALARWGAGLLGSVLLPDLTTPGSVIDSRLLLFTSLAAAAAGFVTGLAPALQAVRLDVTTMLHGGARDGASHRSPVQLGLLVMQGALSTLLLVGAGLFMRSLHNVRDVRLGFDADRLSFVAPVMRGVVLSAAETSRLHERLTGAARVIPGVDGASRTESVPFYWDNEDNIFIPGRDSVNKLGSFVQQSVSPGYFATAGTRILHGRGITDEDRPGAPRAVVVSRMMAATLWPAQEAIGKCVKVSADTMPCNHVVGIAEDIKQFSLRDDPGLEYYLAAAQADATFGVYVRTSARGGASAETIRRALQREMPGVSYVTVTPLSQILEPVTLPWQLGATMFTMFGGLALLVAAVGLYSVLAYGVAQRSREIGVRVALGARPRDVVTLVLREGLGISLGAIALGVVTALLAGRWLAPLLFSVSPRDPVTYGTVALVLLLVTVIACLAPAQRAARTDPNIALRAE
ncbi:MAG TPA: ADOP family duplicated permease [Gemmatimonadaceae bacterium]|nr:ADOP family duplicated permease [Gemmatimonadaceae bacterium]